MSLRFTFTMCLLSLSALSHAEDSPANSSPEKVIVTQGSASLTLADVDAYLQRVPEGDRAGLMDSPKRIEELLLNMLRVKQLANQARQMKLNEQPMVMKEVSMAEDEVLARERVNAFISDLHTPNFEALAKEEYQTHKTNYSTRSNVEVQHILISSQKRSDEEALQLAKSVRQEIVASPTEFDNFVKKYSDDQSKEQNRGHIKDALSPNFAPEFSAAAAMMKAPGEISPPIKTKFGYHLIKLISVVPGKQSSFEEVKEKIEASLAQRYSDEQRNRFIAEISNQKTNADAELVNSLRFRYLRKGQMTPEEAAKNATSVQTKAQKQ